MYVKKSDFEKAHLNYDVCMSGPAVFNEISPYLMWRDNVKFLYGLQRKKYDWNITRLTVRILRKVYGISFLESSDYIAAVSSSMSRCNDDYWTDEFLAFDFMGELIDVFHADDYELFCIMIDYLCDIKFPVHIDYCNYILTVCDTFNLTEYRAVVMNYMHVCGIVPSDLTL